MTLKPDPLDELFISEEKILNTATLKEMLIDFVQFTIEGNIYFLPNFNSLNADQKILVYLLAKKALKLKLNKEELTSPREIKEKTGLPRGTVNPTLVKLNEKRLVHNQGGRYLIPNVAIYNIKDFLINQKR